MANGRNQRFLNVNRRSFFKAASSFGFTTAAIGAGAGLLGNSQALAQTAEEETRREANASVKMVVATPYRIGVSRSIPIMQLDFKENIQNFSNGEIYVQLVSGGQLGIGGQLVQKVQAGTIHCALHSVANMAPFASAADLINIPYWCGDNQQFTNLVTSDVWKSEIDPKVEAAGLTPLWYVVTDPRTCAVRKGIEGPIRTPDQIAGIKFRVPGSKILQQFYQMLGANPTPVPWGETPSAMQQGVADALDPSVQALYFFGFTDVLSSISFIRGVNDALVYTCSTEWYRNLTDVQQAAIAQASDVTFTQDLAKIPSARAFVMSEMAQTGITFYSPTDDERAQWAEKGGHQRSEWNDWKENLAGSISKFDQLHQAANTQGAYIANDV